MVPHSASMSQRNESGNPLFHGCSGHADDFSVQLPSAEAASAMFYAAFFVDEEQSNSACSCWSLSDTMSNIFGSLKISFREVGICLILSLFSYNNIACLVPRMAQYAWMDELLRAAKNKEETRHVCTVSGAKESIMGIASYYKYVRRHAHKSRPIMGRQVKITSNRHTCVRYAR